MVEVDVLDAVMKLENVTLDADENDHVVDVGLEVDLFTQAIPNVEDLPEETSPRSARCTTAAETAGRARGFTSRAGARMPRRVPPLPLVPRGGDQDAQEDQGDRHPQHGVRAAADHGPHGDDVEREICAATSRTWAGSRTGATRN
ncbi:unnamed protein product, partial [Prorocentrum cordatum]